MKTEDIPIVNREMFNAWFVACRPRTLWISVSPVIIGAAMALENKVFHLPSVCFAALGAMFIQIGTNLANDYFDFVHGVDIEERLGPVRVAQSGLIPPETIKRGFVCSFILACLCGIYLVCRGGWPILVIGLFSVMLGILYTAGPFPLAYTGMADVFAFLFFGPIAVAGTYYVQALRFNLNTLIAGVAPGLFSVAILTVNNFRDIYTDRKTGKKTLAVRFGSMFARLEYLLCILFACLIPVALYMVSHVHPYQLLASLVFFLAVPSLKIVLRESPGPVYNRVLASTGLLMFVYSVLFSAGWLL